MVDITNVRFFKKFLLRIYIFTKRSGFLYCEQVESGLFYRSTPNRKVMLITDQTVFQSITTTAA